MLFIFCFNSFAALDEIDIFFF